MNLINKKQMAERLSVTPRTLENWMKRGLVPYIRIGRVVRYDLEEVMRTLKRRYGRNYGIDGGPEGVQRICATFCATYACPSRGG